jgi:hypothetical protein
MAKSSRKSRQRKPSTAAKAKEASGANTNVDRFVFPIVIAISALVLVTAALTDQWRGAVITEVQVLVVGAVARWGLRV